MGVQRGTMKRIAADGEEGGPRLQDHPAIGK